MKSGILSAGQCHRLISCLNAFSSIQFSFRIIKGHVACGCACTCANTSYSRSVYDNIMSRAAFRAATLILEKIERHGISLDRAFSEIISKVDFKENIIRTYNFAFNSLFYYRAADYLLSSEKIHAPLRRVCAFRVGFTLLIDKKLGFTFEDLKRISGGLLTSKMFRILKKVSRLTFEDILEEIPGNQRLGVKYSIPDWLIVRLLKVMDRSSLENLLRSTMRSMTWIRINSLKENPTKILKKLSQVAVVRKDKDYDYMYEILKGREQLIISSIVKNGYVIIHDKGSAVVVSAISPEKYDYILDMAAAPGIKTSIIAQLTDNTSRIIALDISHGRLSDMKNLLQLWNVLNVDLILCDSTRICLSKYPRKIIIDAPCSNTGAIASDPGLRLALNKRGFDPIKFQKVQYSMLEKAIKDSKKNTTIVYSTCSLLPEEGELVIEKLLANYDIEVDTSNVIGTSGYNTYRIAHKVKRLFPHINKTTGFFIARIYR